MAIKRQKVILWGTGNVARQVMDNCETLDNYEILGFIDNNKNIVGDSFYGYKIYSPDILKNENIDIIVILNDRYEEIKTQIHNCYPQYDSKIRHKFYFFLQSLHKRYDDNCSNEIKELLEYANKNGLAFFNYKFTEKYADMPIDCRYDRTNGLYYIIDNGKRMYLSRVYDTEDKVVSYCRSILLEQDPESPHKYLDDDFCVNNNDVIVDAGVAEGNFTLSVIDQISRAYLIEADSNWIEALKYTFSDYKNKIELIPKYATSYNEGKFAKLDTIIQHPVNFIKMDIEGNEWDALNGATELINHCHDLKMAICTYHSDFDYELITNFVKNHGFDYEDSNGYMWFPVKVRQTTISTRFHHTLIRCSKNKLGVKDGIK